MALSCICYALLRIITTFQCGARGVHGARGAVFRDTECNVYVDRIRR